MNEIASGFLDAALVVFQSSEPLGNTLVRVRLLKSWTALHSREPGWPSRQHENGTGRAPVQKTHPPGSELNLRPAEAAALVGAGGAEYVKN